MPETPPQALFEPLKSHVEKQGLQVVNRPPTDQERSSILQAGCGRSSCRASYGAGLIGDLSVALSGKPTRSGLGPSLEPGRLNPHLIIHWGPGPSGSLL